MTHLLLKITLPIETMSPPRHSSAFSVMVLRQDPSYYCTIDRLHSCATESQQVLYVGLRLDLEF